jgi:mannose-6-phosphate isomerase-like protein (cupin superfamily)
MNGRVERPWGWYENLLDADGYKVKRLFVEQDKRISLQYHNYRSEFWVVVSGFGTVEIEEEVKDVYLGDYIFIRELEKHRICGGKGGIMIVEVQLGFSCVEQDIVRIEDDFGRI